MSKHLGKIIAGILIICSLGTKGQQHTEDYIFNSIKEGVTKRAVTSITQDGKGFVWISTFGAGLYRFDGVNYKSYTYNWEDSTSITSNGVYQILVDGEDKLWVATDNGVCTYDSRLDQFIRIDIPYVSAVENLAVMSIGESQKGGIYFSTGQLGVLKYDTNTEIISNVVFDAPVSDEALIAWQITNSKEGQLLFATTHGLLELNEASSKLEHTIFLDENISSIISLSSTTIISDSNGDYWIGTRQGGVIKATRDKFSGNWKISKHPVTNKRILSMVETKEGHILVGTENEGLYQLDMSGSIISKYFYSKYNGDNIQSNSIWTLYRDRDDRIWLGYYDKGIGLYDPLFNKFQSLKSSVNNFNSLQVGSVTSIVNSPDGKMWIGMDGGGIDIYNPINGDFEHLGVPNARISGLDNMAVQCVFFDSESNVWAGSWDGGLYYLKNGSHQFVNFNTSNTEGELSSNRIMNIDEDSRGIIWLATFSNGLQSYDKRSKQFNTHGVEMLRQLGVNTSDVRKVLVDRNDNVWIGSTRGLYKISFDKGEVISIESFRERMSADFKDHTSINHVLSLVEDQYGNIWIGTDGGGLCKYDTSADLFIWYNNQNGLMHETVCGIIEDDNGNLWLSGKSGISKFDPKSTEATYFSVLDGLLSNDFNYNAVYKNEQGVIYFGDFQGIDYFHPSEIITNHILPEIFLIDFKLFNRSIQPNDGQGILNTSISETKEISLNHEQSVFTIDFAALNYTRPEDNEYAFYLEGLESDWNYVGNTRSATYTSLKEGKYIFKVKASNNDGVWNEKYRALIINVLPPWWRAKSALTIYIFLFLTVLFVLIKIVRDRAKNKLLVQTEVDKRRNEEELNDKKLQFFTNISHEFRTPLTLILNPLQDILNDPSLNLPETVRAKHNVMLKNSSRLKRLVDELMDFRKLKVKKLPVRAEKLNLGEFVGSIGSYFKEEAKLHNIELSVSNHEIKGETWIDKGMLEKIVFNLLSNAFKVTRDLGKVALEVKQSSHLFETDLEKSEAFEIRISDTGPGLNENQLARIFERFYQVDKKNKEYYGGTGIGLEVVKDFVSLNKGDVVVESKEGEGTIFKLYFRMGNDHYSELQMVKPNEQFEIEEEFSTIVHTEDETNEKLSGKKALVVEDNIELRNYLVAELSKFYKIIQAKNGKEGLEMALEEIPDVIITDVVMPEMNGMELCQYLKSDIKTSHIPVLMLTARSAVEDQLEGIQKGADAYLNKPFDMRVLKGKLKQLIDSREIIFNKYFKGISDSEEGQNANSSDKAFLESLLNYVNQNISQANLSVELLADELSLSRSQLYRKVKSLTGRTANEFIRNVRLEQAKKIIENGNRNISEVSYMVGFSSPSYFTKCFKEFFNTLPTNIH
ncbi:MAG: response regulator [Reichenbachiella sp.]